MLPVLSAHSIRLCLHLVYSTHLAQKDHLTLNRLKLGLIVFNRVRLMHLLIKLSLSSRMNVIHRANLICVFVECPMHASHL